MRIRMVLMLAAVTLVFGGLFIYKHFEQKMMAEGMASFTPPPSMVEFSTAQVELWRPSLTSIGTLSARQGVDIKTETPGLVSDVLFQSGQQVDKGALLIQLDDDIEQANLNSYLASEKLARLTWDRDRTLLKKNAVSQTQFDKSSASLDEARAAVEQTKATLRKKKVEAPFSGQIGIRRVEPGDYVQEGTLVATLQNLDQLYVNFSLPEQDYPALYIGQDISFTVQAWPDKAFSGQVNAINARVDSSTRNIEVRALVKNGDQKLIPGMFADIKVLARDEKKVITVPRTAVTYTLYGDSVFVITGEQDDLSVRLTQVSTGDIRRDRVEIVSGLEAGDRVVSAGQLTLRNGARVALDYGRE